MIPENKTRECPSQQSGPTVNNTEESSRIKDIAITCAVAPIVVIGAGFVAVSLVADAAVGVIDAGIDKLEAGAEVAFCALDDATEEQRHRLGSYVDAKMKQGEDKVDPSTMKLIKGAAKVTYGVGRGGLAVLRIMGHGITGFCLRQRNPGLTRVGLEMIKHGFEDAAHSIEDGAESIRQGVRERRKK